MNKERAITYSLLAHIRNTGSLAKGPIDIFIPLVKRALSQINSEGIYKGESIIEIKNKTDFLYKIDFPIPTLKKILEAISKDVNTDDVTHFQLYGDGAFSINQYTFTDFEDVIKDQEKEIVELEELFKKFCETSELKIENSSSIFKFIEKNKFVLSKYISNNQNTNGEDYTAEAQFIKFFRRIPTIYERIKNIYLGSIISGYIGYNPDNIKRSIELLLDTNFIIGLLDLNTPESTHTCRTLLRIARQQGFIIKILQDTIEETRNLLEAKASFFEKSFLRRKVNTEDVYNACDRRELSKTDLERIADNLENSIAEFEINVIYQTEKLRNEAKFTEEYKIFEKIRNSKTSALHDATAILYIKKKREKKIRDFDKVNAWFVNNSVSVEGDTIYLKDGFQPETIKADNLLNILWLSSPQINKEIEGDDLAEIGLTSIISLTLNKNLPKSQILRELDDNIHKYAKEEISDLDIVRVATRITNKQLKDIEELNSLAEKDKEQFVKRLEEEAAKQKQLEDSRIEKLEKVFEEIAIRTNELEKSKNNYDDKASVLNRVINDKKEAGSELIKIKQKLIEEQNKTIELKRNLWIESKVRNWRKNSWIECCIPVTIFLGALLYILYISNWELKIASDFLKEKSSNLILSGIASLIGFLFSIISIHTLIGKYRNHSNIQSFKKGLKIPDELKEIN